MRSLGLITAPAASVALLPNLLHRCNSCCVMCFSSGVVRFMGVMRLAGASMQLRAAAVRAVCAIVRRRSKTLQNCACACACATCNTQLPVAPRPLNHSTPILPAATSHLDDGCPRTHSPPRTRTHHTLCRRAASAPHRVRGRPAARDRGGGERRDAGPLVPGAG